MLPEFRFSLHAVAVPQVTGWTEADYVPGFVNKAELCVFG